MAEIPRSRPAAGTLPEMATVVAAGTLDTKGHEYEFLREQLRVHDVEVILIDVGVLAAPSTTPDIDRGPSDSGRRHRNRDPAGGRRSRCRTEGIGLEFHRCSATGSTRSED